MRAVFVFDQIIASLSQSFPRRRESKNDRADEEDFFDDAFFRVN